MKENKNLFGRLAVLLFPIAVFILELLPTGAVCIFAPNPTDRVRETFSYFDLTPFGYANFGPFITAVLTCLLIAAVCVFIVKGNAKAEKCAIIISLAASIASLMPLVFGVNYYSLTGAGITICLAVEFALLKYFPQNK